MVLKACRAVAAKTRLRRLGPRRRKGSYPSEEEIWRGGLGIGPGNR